MRFTIILVIVIGVLILVGGTCIGSMLANGLGGPPPTVSEGRPYKLFAMASLVVGPVLAVVGAVLLYRFDRK